MAGKTAILTLKILGDAKDAIKALDDTSSSAGKFQDGVKAAAVPAAAALAGLAAAGLDAASAAAEDAAAADQLALALRNNAGASDEAIANTEDWISKTSKAAAVADDELRPALGTLVRATGDVGESQDAMGVALDVSAATGKDLGSVTDALAKAYGGQTTAIKRLVPGMDDAVLASGDMDAIMGELSRTMGGAATTAAESAAGQMEGMKIQMDEAKESIGSALLPAMSELAGMLQGVAKFIQENTTLFLVLAGVVGAVATAILLLNVAMKTQEILTKTVGKETKIYTAIQWLLNASFWANPVFLIIAGILLLIGAIVLIATKTTWFTDLWNWAWGAIQAAAAAVWDWITGAASAAIDFVAGLWQNIADAAQAVWDWIVTVVTRVLEIIVAVVTAYINIYIAIWELIKAAVKAVWDWVSNIVSTVLDAIKGAVQSTIDTVVRIFESIKSSVGAVWDWLMDKATTVLDAILGPVNAIKNAFDNVADAISSVINWLGRIKMPEALSNIASTISNITPWSVSPGTPAVVAPRAVSAFAAPTLSAASHNRNAPQIVIQGALDPVGVARQIRLILRNDERRQNGVILR
jgi:hypothetical protein